MAEQAEVKEERGDTPGYSKALETAEEERLLLRQRINALPLIKRYDWGPRSAHVANKKYLLFKILWVSFRAEIAGKTEDMPDPERQDLVVAFFEAMRARLGDPAPDPLSEPPEGSSQRPEMRKMAEYVV